MLLGEGPAASYEKAGLAAAMAESVEFIPADAGRMLVVRAGGSDAAEAAALANSVAAELVDNPAAWLPPLPEEQVAALAAAAESARKSFEQYSAGIDSEARATAERALVDERLLNKEIELLQARVAELDGQLREASSMTPADVLQQSLPDRLEFTALEYHRQRHVEAKLAFDQLSRKLGARHPHLVAARDALASAKADIEAELAKLVKSLEAQKADASRQLAELERRQSSVPPEARAVRERLETLEAAARAAEDRYRQARSEGETESAEPCFPFPGPPCKRGAGDHDGLDSFRRHGSRRGAGRVDPADAFPGEAAFRPGGASHVGGYRGWFAVPRSCAGYPSAASGRARSVRERACLANLERRAPGRAHPGHPLSKRRGL